MTETLQRPGVRSRERYPIAADAFLYAVMIFLVVIALQEGIAYLLSGGEMGTWTPPTWLEAIGALGMPLAVIGGPLLAWRVYGRHLGWRELVAAAVGAMLGGAVFAIAFFALVFLTRLVSSPAPEEEGPWGMVIVTALAVVAFLAKPVVVAVRDLAGVKEHARRHGLRLAVVVLGLIAVIASVFVGGETAELGMFLLLPAVPAAVAAIAMDWERDRFEMKEVEVMMASAETRLPTRPPSDRRTMTRYLAAALCGIVGVLYLILLFLVADAESGASENTYGAYLLLAVPYLIGAGLLVAVDRRALWIAGAAIQVVVIVLFVMFGAGVFGPGQGVYDYDALSGLHMGLWTAVITGAQAVLLGLLSYLAFGPHDVRNDVPR